MDPGKPSIRRPPGGPRCRLCALWEHLCVCDLLPSTRLGVHFFLIQHASELPRASNSGRLVPRLYPNSSLYTVGLRDIPFAADLLADPGREFRLLLPVPGADELGSRAVFGRVRDAEPTLVVLDATWAQTRSMLARVPGLASIRAVALPPSERAVFRWRKPPRAGQLSTIEAVVRAVAALEGDDVARPGLRAIEELSLRGLYMRGKLSRDELARACRWPIER